MVLFVVRLCIVAEIRKRYMAFFYNAAYDCIFRNGSEIIRNANSKDHILSFNKSVFYVWKWNVKQLMTDEKMYKILYDYHEKYNPPDYIKIPFKYFDQQDLFLTNELKCGRLSPENFPRTIH